MAPIFDVCSLTIGLVILIVPPLAVCWTAAVVAFRFLHDRPVGFRGTLDAMATGFQLQLIWLFTSSMVSLVAGPATILPFLYWTGEVPAKGWPLSLAAAALAVAVVTWKVVWPILREEWRRLTGADSPAGS